MKRILPFCLISAVASTTHGAGVTEMARRLAQRLARKRAGREKMPTFLVLLTFCAVGIAPAQYDNNQTAVFNGTSSYFAVPSHSELSPTSQITIEAWIKPTFTAGGNIKTIWGGNYNLAELYLGIYWNGGYLYFKANGPDPGLFSKTPITPNQWTHIAVTYDGAESKIYLNGILDTSAARAFGVGVLTDSTFIGGCLFNGSMNLFFPGEMDNLRLWSIARTQGDIQRDMNIPLQVFKPTGPYAGLLDSWCFDSFLPLVDGSGAVNNNCLNRNVTFRSYNQKPVNYVDYNNCLVLDGQSWCAAPDITDFDPTSGVTVEAWVRPSPNATPSNNIIVSKNYFSSYMLNLQQQSGGVNVVQFYPKGGAGVYVETPSSFEIPFYQWTHVAATYDGTTTKVYINGKEALSSNAITGSIGTNTDSLKIGTNNSAGYNEFFFNGMIDEVRIWNYARTQTQINELMFATMTYVTTGLGLYNFNEWTNSLNSYSAAGYVPDLVFRGNAFISSPVQQSDFFDRPPIITSELGTNFADGTWLTSTKRALIPDGLPTGFIDSVLVITPGIVSSLKMFVLVNHLLVSDLTVQLVAPSGFSSIMFNGQGGGNNDLMTIFDDTADFSVMSGILPPYSPTIKPAAALSGFNGQSAAGWWKIRVVDNNFSYPGYFHGWGLRPTITPTGVDLSSPHAPTKFKLYDNYPNPFNPSTVIRYQLPVASHVTLKIYTLLGKEIAMLADVIEDAGYKSMEWDASALPSGVYFCRLEAVATAEPYARFTEAIRVTLLK